MKDLKEVSTSNPIKLSIIIVSYNTKDITRQCIKSIYNAKWKESFEIIVVDNASIDGSGEMIRSEFPEIILITNKENKYFAIPNNQGAAVARGEYLLLLNSDAIIYDNNIQKMLDFFDSQAKNVICIGPKILNKDKTLQSCGYGHWGNTIHYYFSVYSLSKILPKYFLPSAMVNCPNNSHQVGWVSGCCMMMRTELYKAIGGLNENLVIYGEEPEFGYRSKKLGYQTLYFSGSEIIHLGGASTDKSKFQKKDFERDFKEYSSLVRETIGYRKGIKFAKIMRTSLRIKKIFYKDKSKVQDAIEHENRNIKAFKQLLMDKHEVK